MLVLIDIIKIEIYIFKRCIWINKFTNYIKIYHLIYYRMLKIPENVYVFKNNNKHVGVYKNNNLYLVSIHSLESAKRIKRNIGTSSRLKTSLTSDTPVEFGLMHILKTKQNDNIDNYEIEKIDTHTFMAMPFRKNLGIAMGIEIIKDNINEYCLSTLFIDPLYDISQYRENMFI